MSAVQTDPRPNERDARDDRANGAPRSDRPREDPPQRGSKRRRGWLVLGVILLVAIVAGGIYWFNAGQYEETDDASIDGTAVPVSARISGHIQQVLVEDNQDVTKGQLLLDLDPHDIKAQLDRATATLAAEKSRLQAAQTNVELTRANTQSAVARAQAGVTAAQASVLSAQSQLASAQADVTAAEAESTRRQADLKRYQSADPRGVSQQQVDAARAAADAAAAQLNAAQKRVAGAQGVIEEQQAKVEQAKANLQAAQTAPQQVAAAEADARTSQAVVEQAEADVRSLQLQLSYTKVYAPTTGRVTKKSVVPGQNVAVGRDLLAIVEPDVWVVANFKETQLTHMRAGQDVSIKVDAYPGRIFHGKVDSIQAGTGARFSLLPPENATGNFVKVVQRIPVKIVFSNSGEKVLLAPGMSVVPHVSIGGEQTAPEPIGALDYPSPTTSTTAPQ